MVMDNNLTRGTKHFSRRENILSRFENILSRHENILSRRENSFCRRKESFSKAVEIVFYPCEAFFLFGSRKSSANMGRKPKIMDKKPENRNYICFFAGFVLF